MATYNIFRIRIGSVGDIDYPTGSIVYVKWDDVAEDFQVDVHDSGDTYVSTETSGPDLTVDDYIEVVYNYQFCDSSTLVTFTQNYTTFPYAVKVLTPDAAQCVLDHICDLVITGVTVTNASTELANDGAATIVKTGTAGGVLYSLSPDSGWQSSPVFTSLSKGSYTAYSKDAYSCTSSRAFIVESDYTYAVRWRAEFDARLKEIEDFKYRIDILERDYVGAVTEVKGTEEPIVISYQGENEGKYKEIISSKATIGLTVTTPGEFEDMFTGDERQFLINFYIDEGAGLVLEWTGYVLQETYEEDWAAAPYYIKFIATDGLGDIDSETYNIPDSIVKGSASLIEIISQCLAPTDLNLNINSCINRFEINHDTAATDDPLAQTYFDTYFLNGKTKAEILTNILRSFGARIFQSATEWWIVSIEDTVSSTLPYRTFDSNGTYVSNSSVSPLIDLDYPENLTDRVCWSGTPLMRIKNGYKDAIITHNLGLVNNIYFTGRFHEDDFSEDTGLFDDIGLDLTTGAGADYGLENITDGQSDHAFYIDFQNASTTTLNNPFIYTLSPTVTNDTTLDSYTFSFYYYVNSNSLFTRFYWSVNYDNGTKFLQPSGTWSTDTQYEYVPIYVEASNYNKWNKFEIDFRTTYFTTDKKLQAKVKLYSNNAYDFSSLTALQTGGGIADVAPYNGNGYRIGDRRIVLDTVGSVNYLRHYTLQYSDAATSSPDVIRAADFNATTNPRVWFLDDTTEFLTLTNQVRFYLLDELTMAFYPNDLDPPETKEYSTSINAKNKIDFELDSFFGDLPGTDNDEYIYKNFYELSDGTPTSLWGRTTITESLPLLQILTLDVAGQYVNGARTLNGSLVGDKTLRMHNSLVDVNDGDRKFMILGMEADYANNRYTVELPEIKTGVGGPPSDTSGLSLGFSLGFRS